MTWTKLSDDHFDQIDRLTLSRSALLLDVEAIVWCNRILTDGRVPKSALARFTSSDDPKADAAELVEAGVWTDDGDAYLLDWSDQEPAERVQRGREYRAEKQARYRDRKTRHDAGDHSVCDARFCKSALPVTKPDTSLVTSPRSVTGTRPDLSRPKGRDREQGAPPANGAGAPTAPGAQQVKHIATLEIPVHDWE